MDHDNNSKISLVYSFAYLIKKFWVLLIGALVGMALLLTYHYISSNTTKKTDAYNEKLSKYKEELTYLESIQDNLNLKLEFANEVESLSPIFSNNTIYVSRVLIAVDSKLVSDSESKNDVVAQELSNFWGSLDLTSLVGSDLDNDVLKASTIFECAGQSASIKVYNEDKDKAGKYAASIVDAFVNYFDARDGFSIGSKTIATSIASKNEIASTREKILAEKTVLRKTILDTEAELKTLKKNAPSKYHPLKNAVIGFFIGGFFVALVLGMGFVFRNPMVCSFDTEKELGIPFLGALFTENDYFSKVARRIIGERAFKDYDEAVEYLESGLSSKSFKSLDCGSVITIVSSLKDQKVAKKANEIKDMLRNEGYEATYIGSYSENPHAIKTIEESGAVIILERQWISRMQLICMNKDLASNMNKTVLGFIIC